MTRIRAVFLLTIWSMLASAAAFGQPGLAPRLRVVTINAWSGLDYEGLARIGEYEPAERRARRFSLLVSQLKALDPDVVFVQEANSAAGYAARLASALGLSEIHQVVNGGLKLGPIGFPTNLKEGIAILARPALALRHHDSWKLSGSFGLHGDVVTLHFGEAVFSLAGRILVGETPVYLVNVHLVSSAAGDSAELPQLRDTPEGREMPEAEFAAGVTEAKARHERRRREVASLVRRLDLLPEGAPVVIAGDFNAEPASPEMREFAASARAIDTLAAAGRTNTSGSAAPPVTWDPSRNTNIAFSRQATGSSGRPLSPLGRLGALDAAIPRQIDYIFLGRAFRPEDVTASSVVLDAPDEGLHPSDHFGVLADVDLGRVARSAPRAPSIATAAKTSLEVLPILMYDTDIGAGYGLKAFVLNPLRRSESFDLTVFNSSKGERWYRFVFSLPDFELRQGSRYPLALDLSVDYDKMIRNNFFGVGSASRDADREIYTREPVDVSLRLSRGFTTRMVGQLGVRYTSVKNFGLAADSRLRDLLPALNTGRMTALSAVGAFRYDSRNSFIDPSDGIVLQAEGEVAPKSGASNTRLARAGAWFQYYSVIFYPKTVFAFRAGGQAVSGTNLPVQALLSLGGNATLRGSPQDRYLDRSYVLTNAELRFPIAWRLGGVLGVDAGKVLPSLRDASFRGWTANPVAGLRLYMKTFVVRADLGLGSEGTGFYFNFGHIF
jgi:endonuclease/exonuclease/phosphatase family metal-dependent hydrolase